MKRIEYGQRNRETILLLHGGGLSWWNYRAEAEILSSRFHVVLPVLDGHAGSDEEFTGIEANARRIISFIEEECGGSVCLMGGLSLGAQILAEILSQRQDICRYAILESASVIPAPLTRALIAPAIALSHGLIRKRRFAELQFRSLHIREDLFDDYFRDTSEIAKGDLIAFLRASAAYRPKEELRDSRAAVRILVGGREQGKMLRSAKLLHARLPESRLEIKDGLYHGEYSLNCPERYVRELLNMLGE